MVRDHWRINLGRNRHSSRFALVVASAIAIGLGSCASTPTAMDNSGSASPNSEAVSEADTEPDPELQIVTTIVPMTQFTKAVAGDRAEVIQLLPVNVGPHDYQAKPTDVVAIANADVLVKNGLELEFFLDDLIQNAGNANLTVVDSSEGISTLATQDESHDHAEADAHNHGEADPHVWLDPKRAVEQVENIRDGLIAADPEGEADYMANAAAYIDQLQDLDNEITAQLAPYAGQTFIAFHDFAFYFADSYDLNVEYLVDIPEENPSPDDVRRIIETAKAENINALLTEPQAGENAFDSLAKDLNVEVSAFDPMETGESTAIDPDYYFTVMRNNVDSLQVALGQPSQSWRPLPQTFAMLFPFTAENLERNHRGL